MKPNHKWRVNVYLGKDLYTELEDMGNLLGLSVSQMARIILTQGKQVADTMERNVERYGRR